MKANSKLQIFLRNHLDTTFPVIKGMESMPFSQFQFAVRKISLVCHDCSETRRGDAGVTCQQSLNNRTPGLEFGQFEGKASWP